ncbi:LysE family transporter, partial [Escherichia coli]|nr:LysE family transporter [Escherichia coli]
MIAFLPGFLTGLSLIIAIGAQNAFVIRQGLTKKHVLLVVAICAFSDAALILLGVAGLGA